MTSWSSTEMLAEVTILRQIVSWKKRSESAVKLFLERRRKWLWGCISYLYISVTKNLTEHLLFWLHRAFCLWKVWHGWAVELLMTWWTRKQRLWPQPGLFSILKSPLLPHGPYLTKTLHQSKSIRQAEGLAFKNTSALETF